MEMFEFLMDFVSVESKIMVLKFAIQYLQKFQVAVEQMVVEHKEQDPLAVVNQCQEFAADCSTLVDESMVEALPMGENNFRIY